MKSVPGEAKSIEVHVENIGGIDETTATIPPGVTVLVGRNATNRTSFLKAIMALLGTEEVSLKGGRSTGRVDGTIEGAEYTRTATRHNGTVKTGGDPYLDSVAAADSFAFLLNSNDARRAVEGGRNLRDVVLEPFDVGALRETISELEHQRARIAERLDHRSALQSKADEHQTELERIDQDLTEARDRFATLQSAIETADDTATASLVERYQSVAEVRNELEEVRYEIQTVEEGVSALRSEQRTKRSKLDEIEPIEPADELQERFEDKRRQRQQLDSRLTELQRVVQFNRQRLESSESLTRPEMGGESDPTNQLLKDTTTCWTCGSTVETNQIRSTVQELEAYRQELLDRRESIGAQLPELEERLEDLEDRREAVRALRDRLDEIEAERERREGRLQTLQERKRELETVVERSHDSADEPSEDDQLLETYTEASRLEATIDHLEHERESVQGELDSTTEKIDELADLENRKATVTEELRNERDAVDSLERSAIETFNSKMEEILDQLGYDNIERIWLERRINGDTDDIVPDADFDLHVVRTTDDGTVYEDTVGHLSESEREITGLVFALAGYLAHEVHERLPFLVLDSLEAIDGERIATLIDYMSEYATFVLVALLPDDAQYVEADHRITDI